MLLRFTSHKVAPVQSASFPLVKKERSMPPDGDFKSPEDFLNKMESGSLDSNLTNELQGLTTEQLDEIARLLMERDGQSRGRSN